MTTQLYGGCPSCGSQRCVALSCKQPETGLFRRQIDESRELRDRHDMASLRRAVDAYNDQQGMACVGLRMDPYNPCNGDMGRLCMGCPRKKTVAIITSPIPG